MSGSNRVFELHVVPQVEPPAGHVAETPERPFGHLAVRIGGGQTVAELKRAVWAAFPFTGDAADAQGPPDDATIESLVQKEHNSFTFAQGVKWLAEVVAVDESSGGASGGVVVNTIDLDEAPLWQSLGSSTLEAEARRWSGGSEPRYRLNLKYWIQYWDEQKNITVASIEATTVRKACPTLGDLHAAIAALSEGRLSEGDVVLSSAVLIDHPRSPGESTRQDIEISRADGRLNDLPPAGGRHPERWLLNFDISQTAPRKADGRVTLFVHRDTLLENLANAYRFMVDARDLGDDFDERREHVGQLTAHATASLQQIAEVLQGYDILDFGLPAVLDAFSPSMHRAILDATGRLVLDLYKVMLNGRAPIGILDLAEWDYVDFDAEDLCCLHVEEVVQLDPSHDFIEVDHLGTDLYEDDVDEVDEEDADEE